MKPTRDIPSGVFKGRNFMTPEWIGYYSGTVDGRTAYAELSEGRGMTNNRIFGVTVRDAANESLKPDRSRLFHSLSEARDYIEGLSNPD